MQIKIGEKIKELRARDGRTQNDLATAVGVSCQAVSRWEANGGYPDMEIIPAIANYFHVTIDELYGYHGDREEKIADILKEANKILLKYSHFGKGELSEDVKDCIQLLRTAADEFPNESKILLKLATALHMWGWHKHGMQACPPRFLGIYPF
jgi:transcriptional regulator with XRE-family HTH domain